MSSNEVLRRAVIGLICIGVAGALITAFNSYQLHRYESKNGLAVIRFYDQSGERRGEERRVPLIAGVNGDQFVTEALLLQASEIEPGSILVVFPGGQTLRISPSSQLDFYGRHPKGVALLAQSMCEKYGSAGGADFCRWSRWPDQFPTGGTNP